MGSRRRVATDIRPLVTFMYIMLGVATITTSTASRVLQQDHSTVMEERQQHCPLSYSRKAAACTSEASHSFHSRVSHAAAMTVAWRRKQYRARSQGSRKAAVSRMPEVPNSGGEILDHNEGHGVSSRSNSSVDYNIISETCAGSHGLEVQQDNSDINIRGLPVYHVTVINTCLDCSVGEIHIACGAWASATEVNPKIFRRVADNDCVVNDGRPISSQSVVYFEYTNSFPYPMNLRSATPSCS